MLEQSSDEYLTAVAYSTIYYAREYSSFQGGYGYRLISAEGGFYSDDKEVAVSGYKYEALNRDVVGGQYPAGFSSGVIECGRTWSYTCTSDYITNATGMGECGVNSFATCRLINDPSTTWEIYCQNFVPSDMI